MEVLLDPVYSLSADPICSLGLFIENKTQIFPLAQKLWDHMLITALFSCVSNLPWWKN